jgi:hypothetical protein
MKNKIFKTLLMMSAFALIIGCNEDDLTGDSTKKASSPSLTVALDFASSQTIVEQEASYGFTVTLSEPQIVDVRINLSQIAGTATDGVDFSIPHTVTIPAGSTSVSDVIAIHADDLIEETETATIKIATGTESNVSSISSATVSFNILNLTEGDLAIGMSWDLATSITDNFGNVIGAYSEADLRLLLTDVPFTTILDDADGASAESYVLSGSAPDGEYYIVADFYDAMSSIPVDVNINVSFNQTGVINDQTHSFSNALNTGDVCAANYYVLVKITKTGDSYAFEEVGQPNFAVTSWSGGTDVVDAFSGPTGWASQITTSVDCNGTFLRGINASWMLNVWSEPIIDEANVYYTTDGAGNITIASQYCFTTLYSGVEYPYTISGTGVIDNVTGTLTINYDLDQDGFSPDDWMFANGYMAQDYFIADVTRD